MADTYAELRSLTEHELVEQYDRTAPHTSLGLNFLREELARRDAEKSTTEIVAMTRVMRNLTWAVTVLTAFNVFLVLLTLAR